MSFRNFRSSNGENIRNLACLPARQGKGKGSFNSAGVFSTPLLNPPLKERRRQKIIP